jgi:leader peptidase (prepilin peptidase) / N-methyltransferase
MGVVTPAVAAERLQTRAPLRPAHASIAAAVSTIVAAATLLRLTPSAWTVVAALAAGMLVWVASIDLESRLLPDKIVLPTAALVVVFSAAFDGGHAVERLVAAACAFAFLLVAVVLRPGALGMGDAKLALLLGALLGSAVFPALVVGFAAVGLVGLALVARRGRDALKLQLPLGPFLAFAAIAVLLVHG